jgi:hypothetical protein
MTAPATSPRAATLRTALRLEYLTVGWNVVEGLVAITAAVAAGSVALFGFGVDSFECASGGFPQRAEDSTARPSSEHPVRADCGCDGAGGACSRSARPEATSK